MEQKDFKQMVQPLVEWQEGGKGRCSVIVLTLEKTDAGDDTKKDGEHTTLNSLQAAVLGNGECLSDSIVELMGKSPEIGVLIKKGVLVASLKKILEK